MGFELKMALKCKQFQTLQLNILISSQPVTRLTEAVKEKQNQFDFSLNSLFIGNIYVVKDC